MSEGKGPGQQEAATRRDVNLKEMEGPSMCDKCKLIKKCCVQLPTVSCPLPGTQTIFVDLMEGRNNLDKKFLGFISLLQTPFH